jgi:hypothetical protein
LNPTIIHHKEYQGVVSLFDGKTLNGWVPVNAAPDTFLVRDGMLITTGVPTGAHS